MLAKKSLGPRCQPVYEAIRSRIVDGRWAHGTKLPSQAVMAAEFNIAIMTLRIALDALSKEGLVTVDQGRGTFVRSPGGPVILVVDDDASTRELLREVVESVGYQVVEAADPTAALSVLESQTLPALVLTDVRMPTAEAGISFIQMMRRRWPALPVAAVTGYPQDLAVLHKSPESPVLVVPKPFFRRQIEELLALVVRGVAPSAPGGRLAG